MTDTTLTSQEVDWDDVPDFSTASAANDVAPDICKEPGCQNPVMEYSGRGPRPKFCAEHKPVRAAATATRKSRSWANADEVEKQLNLYVYALAGGLQFTLFSRDGIAIQQTGPGLVHEVIELAKTDKNLRDVLDKLAAPGKYAGITMAAAAVIVSVLANHIPVIAMAAPFVPGAVIVPDTQTAPPASSPTFGGESN